MTRIVRILNPDYRRFDSLKESERRAIFEIVANDKGTNAQAIEKDFWVCRVIDGVFRGLPARPKPYFKGGTSLSKGYQLINRFSEDVDLVLSRRGLGITANIDPVETAMSADARKRAVDSMLAICRGYVQDEMRDRLGRLFPECEIEVDEDVVDGQALRVQFPSILAPDDYQTPWVKLECGARGALEPDAERPIAPFVQAALGADWNLTTQRVTLVHPERTFWEKIVILHGFHCRFRDEGDLLSDRQRASRHYYDLAMMFGGPVGKSAVKKKYLLSDVCEHSRLVRFSRAWQKLGEARPGTLQIAPPDAFTPALAADYGRMKNMMFHNPPSLEWILEQLKDLDAAANKPEGALSSLVSSSRRRG